MLQFELELDSYQNLQLVLAYKPLPDTRQIRLITSVSCRSKYCRDSDFIISFQFSRPVIPYRCSMLGREPGILREVVEDNRPAD